MIEIVRYRYRSPNGKTSEEHLTLAEAAEKYPAWQPWPFSKRVERIPEPGDPVVAMPPSPHPFVGNRD
ncbi:hypothetical protein [Variovorax ginsengisoli]|uniref:Uncharacterized protein n=1 Tax=Variovorax ginsengisoli TaxID=363844 RepID=A0ABT8S2J9_9BURK|nr:hypothetical protein [Variovorax ginsengisoli]MDN8613984.1 hypothetical protein [Variovorax ginsengisoli]MDO1533154.1 hypothetical protein [Variovorax ginsengisoli]